MPEPVSGMAFADQILAAFGVKKIAALAGLIGGIVSLRFFADAATMSFCSKLVIAASGAAIANYLTEGFMSYFSVKSGMEGAIGFLLGLFGMSVTAAIIKGIGETDWASLIKNRIGKRK